jgi:hypothetical protein
MDNKNFGREREKITDAAGDDAKVAVESTKNGVAIKVTLCTKKRDEFFLTVTAVGCKVESCQGSFCP